MKALRKKFRLLEPCVLPLLMATAAIVSPHNSFATAKGSATGGMVTTNNGYLIHTFTNVGNSSFVVSGSLNCEILVVAGGGGGGQRLGGGGGAGGVVWATNYTVTEGTKTITVGDGGKGAIANGAFGTNGDNSYFDASAGAGVKITAIGGGGGGSYDQTVASASGGSGGGAVYTTGTPRTGGAALQDNSGVVGAIGYGNAGGTASNGTSYSGSGGGGAGGAGSNTTASASGWGGIGMEFSQFATVGGAPAGWFGGGGGGGYSTSAGGKGGGGGANNNLNGDPGTNNTGGGGGSARGNADAISGGKGGSGIVIVKYIPGGYGPSTNLPYTDDFESYTNLQSLTGGLNGWYGSSADVLVVSNTDYAAPGSTNSARIPADCLLSNGFQGIAPTNVWIQMDLRPALFAQTNSPAADTNQAYMLYVNTSGYFVVYNSAVAGWVTASNFNIGTSGTNWVTIGIYEDFNMRRWHLYATTNSVEPLRLVTNNILFVNQTMTNFAGFQIYNGITATSYLDNVSVMVSNKSQVLTITGSFTVSNKVYDASAMASISNNSLTLAGTINPGDDVSLAASALFDTKDAGTNKLVTLMGSGLAGTNADNYTLSMVDAPTCTGAVTQATMSASLVAPIYKTYDGLTNATLFSGNYSLSGLAGSEMSYVNQTVGGYVSSNVATAISVIAQLSNDNYTNGANGFLTNNYILPATAAGSVGIIGKKTMTVSLVATISKTYDGLTNAVLGPTNFLLGGLVLSETCDVNRAVGGFVGSNVSASAIAVNATLSNTNFTNAANGFITNNYNLPTSAAGTVGVINRKTMTANLVPTISKPYDGNTTATVGATNYSLVGLVFSQTCTVNKTTGTYATQNAGSGIGVTVALATNNFTNAANGFLTNNYLLPTTATGDVGVIVGLPVTISGSFTVSNKVYDGTTDASISNNLLKLDGTNNGDVVTLTAVAAFADSKAGVGKTVSLTNGTVLGGADAGKYSLSLAGAPTTTADINKATQLDITFNPTSPQQYNTTNLLSASGGSGTGAFSYAVQSGPGQIVLGSNLWVTNATGTIVVRATKAEDDNYAVAYKDANVDAQMAGQTITFAAIAAQPSGNLQLTLSATASSGLPVSFSNMSGPGTISGNVITFNGVGENTVKAYQTGDVNWAAAPEVLQTFPVYNSAGTPTTSIVPWSDNFETNYLNLEPLINGTNGWYGSSANIIVQTNSVALGTKAAMLPVDCTLSNRFVPTSPAKVWIQMDMRPSLYSGTTNPAVDTNQAGIFYINTSGYFVVHNGAASPTPTNSVNWVTLTNSAINTNGSAWVTNISIYADYSAKKWDLYTNGVLVTNNIGFVNNTPARLNDFDAYSGSQTSYLDNMSVTSAGGTIGLSTATLAYAATYGSLPSPSEQTLIMTNLGNGSVTYSNTVTYGLGSGWFAVTPVTGNVAVGSGQILTGTVASASLTVGVYVATNTITSDADNSPTQVVATLTVTQKVLTVTGTFTVSNKLYDASALASISNNSLTLVGINGGDDVTLTAAAAFDNKNAGTGKSVSLAGSSLGGAKADQYMLSLAGAPTASADIAQKEVTVSGAVANNKGYDGTTDATINMSAATTNGIISPDAVVVTNLVGTFAQSAQGVDIPVTAALALTGADGGNYYITQPTGLKANIGIGTAIITLSNLSQPYNGTARPVTTNTTPSGLELVVTYDGNLWAPTNVGSYAVTGTVVNSLDYQGTNTATLVVTQAVLTIGGTFTASNKFFDATTTASISNNSLTLSGIFGGDDVTLTAAAAFDDPNIGVGKTVRLTGSSLGGTKADQYMLSLAGAPTTTADIYKGTQTIYNFTPTNGSVFAVTSTVTLAAQATSQLMVSFTNLAGNPVSWLDTTTITFTAVGTVSIVASQAGDANCYPAENVTNTYTVVVANTPTSNSIPWSDGFEYYANLTPLVNGIGGWYGSSAGIVVQQDVVRSGLQAAMLPMECTLSNAFVPANKTNVLMQMDVMPSLYNGISTQVVNTNKTWLFYINSNGNFVVHNGPATNPSPTNSMSWVTLTSGVVKTNDWVTIGIYEDFTRKEWDLYTNGVLVTNSIKFVNQAATNFNGFNIRSGASTSYVDNFSVVASNRTAGNIGLDTKTLTYTGAFGVSPSNQTVIMTNLGQATFTYSNTVNCGAVATWLTVTPPVGVLAGSATQGLIFAVNSVGLGIGQYVATNTITADADNTPQEVVVTLTVGKNDQTITNFPNPGDQITTNLVVLWAQASSGLAVTNFTVIAGPGKIDSQTNLTFTNSGSVSVTADQPGDANWNAAPTVTNTFNVTKAMAIIILDNTNQVYNGTARNVATSTVPVGLPLVVTYDGNAWAPTNVGTYAVIGTINDLMYQGTTNTTLVVTQNVLTIGGSFTASNKVYDATTTASISNNSLTLSGVFGGDDVTLTAVAAFDDPNVGVNKPVRLNGSSLGGTAQANYMLSLAGAPTTLADIYIADQVITNFTPTNGSVFAQTSIVELAAQASSGLTVSFTNLAGSPVSWLSATSITFTGIGTVKIKASQAGDANWSAAADVTNTYTILPAATATTNSIPWYDDFELYANLTPLVGGVGGWYGSSAGIVVQQDVRSGGLQAAMLPMDCILTNPFVPANTTNVWFQMDVMPSLYNGSNTAVVDTNTTWQFYINSNGNFVVHNGPATNPAPLNSLSWVTLTNGVVGTNDWVTIGIYEDFTSKSWDLYTNGVLVTNNIKFVNQSATNFRGFVIGSGASTSYLDNGSVTVSNRAMGHIGLSTNALTYSTSAGVSPANQTVIMTNLGQSAFTFSNTATYGPGGAGWLTVTPVVGDLVGSQTQQLVFAVNSIGLGVGVYVATNTITANADNTPQDVVVTLTVGKGDQTITNFPNPGDQITTNTVGLWAQASSGLEVSNFTVIAGPGVITGLTNLTFTNSGSVSVTADQPGDNNFNAAPTVTNTFNVSKASPIIILDNTNQAYNGTARNVTTSTVPAGLPLVVTYDGNAWAPTNVGSYAVIGTVSDDMYQGSTNVTLVVTQSVLTIGGSFTASNKVYDATTAASISNNSLTLSGIYGSDDVTLTPVVAFDTATAGVNKTVSLTNGTALGGTAQANYMLSLAGAPTALADIYKAEQQAIIFTPATPQAVNTTNALSASGGSGTGAFSYAVQSGPGQIVTDTNLWVTNDTGVIVVRATKAADDNYNSAFADANVYASKTSQVITFAAIPAQPSGNLTLTLSATASSGLPVSFSNMSGPGTIVGNVLTFNGPGENTVKAYQTGDVTWAAAPEVVHTFPVYDSAATPTINTIPYTNTFENYFNLEPLINGTNGWYGDSSAIVVQTNIVAFGTKAAMIPLDCTLSNLFVAGLPLNVKMEMYSRFVRSDFAETNFMAVDTNAVAMFYVDTNGHFVVCNGQGTTSTWSMVSNALGTPGQEFIVTNDTWTHVVIYLDYRDQSWKLKANDILITNNIGFISRRVSGFSGFNIYNGSSSTSYLDNVSVNWWDRFKVNGVPDHLIRSVNGGIPRSVIGVPMP